MAQHLIPWSNAFNSLPVPTSKVGQTDMFIRETRQGVSERISQEHNLNTSDITTDNHGKHLQGSARCFISNIAVANPDVVVETVYTGTLALDFKHGRQYFNPETKKLYVYVTNYTYVDAQSVSHTIDGFTEVMPSSAYSASQQIVGTCATAQATQAKVAILDGFTLVAGVRFTIKFTYASVAGATLTVNATGAKTVLFAGIAIAANTWVAGDITEMIYDGTNYHILVIKTASSSTVPKIAAILTGNVTGNLTGNVTGNVTGAVTGNASTATLGLAAGNGSPTTGKIRIPTGQPSTLVKGDMWIV